MSAILREPVSPYFIRNAEAAVYLDSIETVRTNDSVSEGYCGNPCEWEDSIIAAMDLDKAIARYVATAKQARVTPVLTNAERCKAYYERKGRANYVAKTRAVKD